MDAFSSQALPQGASREGPDSGLNREDSAGAGGQHNDAAKALLGLNTVVDLPNQGAIMDGRHDVRSVRANMPVGDFAQHEDSARFMALRDMMMAPPSVPMVIMRGMDPSVDGNSSASSVNTQNRRAADAQLQLASALHLMNAPQQDVATSQKKKRKRGNGKASAGEKEQESSAGANRADGTVALAFDPSSEKQIFPAWALPPTLPQFQTPNGPGFAPNLGPASAPFLAMGQAFANSDGSVAMVAPNGALNGVLAGAQFGANGATQGMLQSVMSQFALGVGGGLFAGVPTVAANGQIQVGPLPNGAADKPPRPNANGKEDANKKGNKDDKGEGKGGRKQRYYKSLSCNYWNSMEDQENDDGGSDDGNMDITTPWRCEVCNIYFTSAQALGGHRINSTDHKQRCEKLRRGDTASLPGTPRLSLHVYSNEETAEKGKRTRLPPMAQMAGFDRVLLGFPSDVRMALARIQSPAAYFSSCSLEVFKRHEKFGTLGDLIINKYFTASSDTFEGMMQNPKAIPEVGQAGFSSDMPDDVHNELKIFARMLLTKKKFLDINRRAVSKRIKGIRKAGGERLKEFNQKKARHAQLGSQTETPSSSAPDAASVPAPVPQPVQATAVPMTAELGASGAQLPTGSADQVPPAVF